VCICLCLFAYVIQNPDPALSSRNRRRRERRRHERARGREHHTSDKHTNQIPIHQQRRVTRRTQASPTKPMHRTRFQGQGLLFIGYGIQIHTQGDAGWGLKTVSDIKRGSPITQYEVCITGTMIVHSDLSVGDNRE
jgi:hypothetical protein